MKHTALSLSCLIGLLTASGGAVETQADGVAVEKELRADTSVRTIQQSTLQLDQEAREAIQAIAAEREKFNNEFDWNSGAQIELQRSYSDTMDSFVLRELEIKHSAYTRLGNVSAAAMMQRSIDRHVSGASIGHEQLNLSRTEQPVIQKEATR